MGCNQNYHSMPLNSSKWVLVCDWYGVTYHERFETKIIMKIFLVLSSILLPHSKLKYCMRHQKIEVSHTCRLRLDRLSRLRSSVFKWRYCYEEKKNKTILYIHWHDICECTFDFHLRQNEISFQREKSAARIQVWLLERIHIMITDGIKS